MRILSFAIGLLFAVSVAAGESRAADFKQPGALQSYGYPYNWSGLSIGAETTYAWQSVVYQNPGTPVQDLSGGLVGVRFGYDYQFDNRIVLGVLGSIGFGNLSTTVRDGNYITESGSVRTMATVLGRVGYAFDRFLPYVAGGAVFANLEQGEACPSPAAAPFGFCHTHGPFTVSQSSWHTGLAVGGGIAFAIARNWNLDVSYLYTKFPEKTYVLGPDGTGAPLPASLVTLGGSVAKLAIVYKF